MAASWLPIFALLFTASMQQQTYIGKRSYYQVFDNAKNLLIWIPIAIYLPRFVLENIAFKTNSVLKFNRNLTLAFCLLAFVMVLYYSKSIF